MEKIEKDIASGRIVLPVMYNRVTSPNLHQTFRNADDEDDSSDECSSQTSSSCYSKSSYESSEAEWESSVDAKGELIFVNCEPLPQRTKDVDKETFDRNKNTRRSTRGKLLRLLRRRESKRKINKQVKPDPVKRPANAPEPITNKVTFLDCQEGEERYVSLHVDPKNRIKYGRKASISEAVLGLTLTSFSDNTRLMVAGIMPDATKHRGVKIGDWLKSINDRDVTVKTIDSVLERIKNPCVVRLKLQRVAGVEVTQEPPPNRIPKQSEFVRQLLAGNVDDASEVNEELLKYSVGVMFLNMDKLTENGSDGEEVCYCFPGPGKVNALYKSRGAFLTLHHLLRESLKTKPLATSLQINNNLTHVTYAIENENIFLLAFPHEHVPTVETALAISRDITTTLRFMYGTLTDCFVDSHAKKLDHFFARVFQRTLNATNDEMENDLIVSFEELLPAAHFVPLPRDVQLDLDDCLNDLESCDYREWNEDPMDCQRLFTVIGSSVYHAGYLLASHLNVNDLVDVHAFCRQQGLLRLFRMESVKSFILWREVFPRSCLSQHGGYPSPKGRWFLLIVGSDQDMICVLFEAGGCTVPALDKFIHPDPFYVEEVQYALSDIQYIGVIEVAKKWLSSNIYPQIVPPGVQKPKKRSRDSKKTCHAMTKTISTTQLSKKPEVTSILKRRSNSEAVLNDAKLSVMNDELSDDSRSVSVTSDERQYVPVIGRREARERGVNLGYESDSGSEHNQCCGSNFDLSELRHTLLNSLDAHKPFVITQGSTNVLFHYVQLDSSQGVFLSPSVDFSTDNARYRLVVENFRRVSLKIHTLFGKCVKFKNLLNHTLQEKPVINKSLVAVKEHAVLFECYDGDGKKAKNLVKYWVVGRLFVEPSVKELYVCYDESVPQNMVEISFRLDIMSVG